MNRNPFNAILANYCSLAFTERAKGECFASQGVQPIVSAIHLIQHIQ